IAFVRNLGAPAIDAPMRGNAENGRQVFFGKGGCAQCHAIAGRGGFLGPDLTDAGASRTMSQLRESLLEPNKRIAEGYQAVTAQTRDGRSIEGIAKNHDNYSIQILDTSGKLHLLARDDLEKLDLRDRSLMPADLGRKLNATEVEDVLAYLSRQSLRPREKK